MAGIYIHIPFCKQACLYCNFHFSTSLKLQNDFLNALLKEIKLRKDYLGKEQVDTIYFGGGTPSLLPPGDLSRIMDAIFENFDVSPHAETTFEANPDDINSGQLRHWSRYGINRLSIGVQSFFEEDLLWMNRAHSASQARNCILTAQDAGFHNISIDLIYGTPSLTDEKWQYNLDAAISMNIPHLSCYALTVEPGTALDVLTRKKRVVPVNSEDQARQFLMMTEFMSNKGYEHYEISNFALPGKRSVHNSSYWSGEKYIGLGPSAHSFDGLSRQWNIANNAQYIQSLKDNEVPSEKETLTEVQRFNEYIMTSLRTMEGTDIHYVEKIFGKKYRDDLLSSIKKFVDRGWMENGPAELILTREGKLFADGIASELFII